MNRTQNFSFISLHLFPYIFSFISLSLFPAIFLPCFFAVSVTLTSGNLFHSPFPCTQLSTFAKGKCSLCENIFRMLTP